MLGTQFINPDALRRLLAAILEADGCSRDEAVCVADHLVEANLKGHDSHGVIRITRYHTWLQTGQIKARQPLTPIVDTPGLMQFDGGDGMGQWLAREATKIAIDRAKAQGSAIVALRRAGHIGRLGAYAEQAATAGLVSLQFCNVAGSRLVAPFGARDRCISTAPVAIGMPMPDGQHFILDFATSLVAEGKALVAGKGGKALPSGALIDGDGTLTADPHALYGKSLETTVPNPRDGAGALRTMGEHKGSGLALACELLAGALTGNGTNGAKDHPFGNGLLSILIDPAHMDAPGGCIAEAAAYVDFVRQSQPAAGVDAVLAPGDPERATAESRRNTGVPMPPSVIGDIVEIARTLSIEFDETELSTAPRSTSEDQAK